MSRDALPQGQLRGPRSISTLVGVPNMEAKCHEFRESSFKTRTVTTTNTKSTRSCRTPSDLPKTPSRRGSLSIIQPKVCLNEMLVMARKIWLSNGSNAADIPLPTIAMKFKVLPASGLSVRRLNYVAIKPTLLISDLKVKQQRQLL